VGRGTTDRNGVVRLVGPNCCAPSVRLRVGPNLVNPDRLTLEDPADGLVIVVPDRAVAEATINGNECAAITALKWLSSSEAQAQAAAVIDVDHNAVGEYGFFAELAGTTGLRSDEQGGVGKTRIAPRILGRDFANVVGSRIVHHGYVFQVFLPDSSGRPTAEAATGGAAGVAIDAKKAASLWCCYAWPASPDSGKSVYFIDQGGDILHCRNGAGYFGFDKAPLPNAARAAGSTGAMDSKIAVNAAGLDGETWTVVG
jgi:hypothetical protein